MKAFNRHQPDPRAGRGAIARPNVLIALPIAIIAALPLVAISIHRWPIAQGDTWHFIERYIALQQGQVPWTSLFSAHGPHPGLLLRPITLLPLTLGDGDFSGLPFLSWLTALASFALILLLLRGQAAQLSPDRHPPSKTPPVGLAALALLSAALVFSMGQGLSWTWEFVWINWLPGACLAALLWLDVRHSRSDTPSIRPSGWGARATLALLALIAFGNGMFVWLVLLGGWGLRRLLGHRAAPGWRAQILWAGAFALLTWLLVLYPAEEGGNEGLAKLLDRPLMSLHYVLCLIGGSLANGTVLDPSIQAPVIGGLTVLLLLATLAYGIIHRRDPALQDALIPWFQAAAFAGLACILITMGRMDKTVYTAFASRYLTLTLWLPLAAAATTVFCCRHRRNRSDRETRPGPASPSLAGLVLLGALIPLWAVQGVWGFHEMRWYHREKLTVAAAFRFAQEMPDEMDRALRGFDVGGAPTVRFLIENGKLPGIDPVPGRRVAELNLQSDLKDAEWSIDPRPDALVIEGYARLNSRREPPDLILLTLAPESGDDATDLISALISVRRPRDFERRHYHINVDPDHYLGFGDRVPWERLREASRQFPDHAAAEASWRLRLYAIDFRRGAVRRIVGQQTLALPSAKNGLSTD